MKKFLKLLIVLIILGVIAGIIYVKLEKKDVNQIVNQAVEAVKEPEGPKIYNTKSKERPVAVMLDNNTKAWPHANINNAYLIYEIEVEGGESRLMALFKDKKDVVTEVGPIRSARHYFLDYVLENDAIYAHVGESPQADKDITTLNISDINGQVYDTMKPKNENNEKEFWRSKAKSRPHNSYTSIRNLFNIATSKNYSTEINTSPVFKYAKEEVNLEGENVTVADKVTAQYHSGNRTVFEYDSTKKEYTKTSKKVKQKDEATKEDYTIKNLIILNAEITNLKDAEAKGRKDVKTVGTLEGYYITNGKAVKITATKESRKGKTVYKTLDGKEIEINDGRTYVMIVPMDEKILIDTVSKEAETTSNVDAD